MMPRESVLLVVAVFISSAAGSALHGGCDRNENCGTFDTYCRNGTCVCAEDFGVIFDTCVPLAVPRVPCSHRTECKSVLGVKGMCRDGQCVCKPFHHLVDGQCVKSRGLEEICEHTHQCYCGQNCRDKMECIHKTCRCKSGYEEQNRRCIPTKKTARAMIVSDSSISDDVCVHHPVYKFVISMCLIPIFIRLL